MVSRVRNTVARVIDYTQEQFLYRVLLLKSETCIPMCCSAARNLPRHYIITQLPVTPNDLLVEMLSPASDNQYYFVFKLYLVLNIYIRSLNEPRAVNSSECSSGQLRNPSAFPIPTKRMLSNYFVLTLSDIVIPTHSKFLLAPSKDHVFLQISSGSSPGTIRSHTHTHLAATEGVGLYHWRMNEQSLLQNWLETSVFVTR